MNRRCSGCRSMTPSSVTIPYFASSSIMKLAKRIESSLLVFRSGQFVVAKDSPCVHLVHAVLHGRAGVVPLDPVTSDAVSQKLFPQQRAEVLQAVTTDVDRVVPAHAQRLEAQPPVVADKAQLVPKAVGADVVECDDAVEVIALAFGRLGAAGDHEAGLGGLGRHGVAERVDAGCRRL